VLVVPVKPVPVPENDNAVTLEEKDNSAPVSLILNLL
jgi:hypothetical protein